MEKKKKDDLKMEVRNKYRQKQQLEEKHAVELKIYQQKLQHLYHEHQKSLTNVHIDNETSLTITQENQRDRIHEMKTNTRQIKVVYKEAELSHDDLQTSIKLEYEKRIMALRQEFERKSDELKASFEKKTSLTQKRFGERRKRDITAMEERKSAQIAALLSNHADTFTEIKKYYKDITVNNIELIKSLKEKVGEEKKKELESQKILQDTTKFQATLRKPLDENQKLGKELRLQLEDYQKEKDALSQTKESVGVYEERLKNLSWEHEILTQKLAHVKEEKEELQKKLESTIYAVQQKTGFKNLILEKKLDAMTQDLEKTEAALAEVLANTNLKPDVLGEIKTNLEDVLMAKNKSILKLQQEVQALRQRYSTTVQTYEAKMSEHEIPVEELGFTPAKR
eukprot:TRINITY_DN10760_c0_g1_i1.p1 TRINITY_DN10760_c0_g1~~TRINITY_DN10760_c0_g1_i1.p1  ORF type:complete len:396 (-),score=121.38 TRINITY_DN10760_c0_g1_i1:124-1311(-)